MDSLRMRCKSAEGSRQLMKTSERRVERFRMFLNTVTYKQVQIFCFNFQTFTAALTPVRAEDLHTQTVDDAWTRYLM